MDDVGRRIGIGAGQPRQAVGVRDHDRVAVGVRHEVYDIRQRRVTKDINRDIAHRDEVSRRGHRYNVASRGG
jgi:hypothetical protein